MNSTEINSNISNTKQIGQDMGRVWNQSTKGFYEKIAKVVKLVAGAFLYLASIPFSSNKFSNAFQWCHALPNRPVEIELLEIPASAAKSISKPTPPPPPPPVKQEPPAQKESLYPALGFKMASASVPTMALPSLEDQGIKNFIAEVQAKKAHRETYRRDPLANMEAPLRSNAPPERPVAPPRQNPYRMQQGSCTNFKTAVGKDPELAKLVFVRPPEINGGNYKIFTPGPAIVKPNFEQPPVNRPVDNTLTRPDVVINILDPESRWSWDPMSDQEMPDVELGLGPQRPKKPAPQGLMQKISNLFSFFEFRR